MHWKAQRVISVPSSKAPIIELAPYFMMYTNLMTYPLKFRQHVLAIKEKLTYAKTASRFGVGMASLMRWNRRITPCTTHNKPATKIDMEALAQDVATYPDDYQYERAQRFGVSAQGIRHALKRLRVSRKKKHFSIPKLTPRSEKIFKPLSKPIKQRIDPLFILTKVASRRIGQGSTAIHLREKDVMAKMIGWRKAELILSALYWKER
ncbi:transposase [Candidatus Regiella insecticola]|uniref:Transposase n=2 Tax=Candidatus Regiella insecticola TaxID=138073 RepID=A0A6L2ZR62_9ENTR|nr:transposase [Candidatus Regiella insecticola]